MVTSACKVKYKNESLRNQDEVNPESWTQLSGFTSSPCAQNL